MDPTIIAALITGGMTLLAAVLGVLWAPSIISKRHRSQHDTPDILGAWQAKWFIDGDLYVEDLIEISRWGKNNAFEGSGRSPAGSYSLSGRIDSSRIAVATYEDDLYPTKGLIGTILLELSVDAQRLAGHWNGRTADGSLQSGTTEWTRC